MKKLNVGSRFFKDKIGHWVIFQWPNIPLIAWFFCTFISFLANYTKLFTSSYWELLSFGFIFTWSYLEISSGVNYFRRLLGVFVMAFIVIYSHKL